MTSCSTKTRTAALSANTRGRPGPWYGNSRCVRSISANNLPIVVLRSIVINRNCSQNSGSRLIEVSRPLSLTLCRRYCFMSDTRVAQASETPTTASAEMPFMGMSSLSCSMAARPSRAYQRSS